MPYWFKRLGNTATDIDCAEEGNLYERGVACEPLFSTATVANAIFDGNYVEGKNANVNKVPSGDDNVNISVCVDREYVEDAAGLLIT